ncbi:MAG TPA: rod shape-determining protein MreC [Allosphingosinicella sp.]|jgi:rod shape-determining protein MreC
MAPPSKRRPGFSRRAQYGLFLGYVIAVAGILFAVMLLVVATIDPRGFAAIRGAALDATTPVSSGGRSIVRLFTGGGESIGNYFNAAATNGQLKRELAATRRRLVEARAIEFENRRLKRLLKLSETVSNRVTTARIVGSSFDSSRRLATLAAGSSDGVRAGQPVRAPEGLIGRVLETGRWASRILLITDGGSNVPVQLVRNGTPAIASGRGDGLIDLKTLEVGESPFKRGDIVVTSGIGGIYPPLVPVAIVIKADRDATVARPLADPARIDFAIVETIYQPAASAPVNEAEAAQAEASE